MMRRQTPALKVAGRSLALVAAAIGLSGAVWTQPQTVVGPCTMKSFFIVSFGTSNTQMTVDRGAKACEFTLIYSPFNRFQTAALITSLPRHGQARAALIEGGTSAAVSYTPAPGYVGPDTFTATLQPGDKAVIVSVTVKPPGAQAG